MKIIILILFLAPFLPLTAQLLYPYSDGKKWGLTNQKLEIIIPPQYDSSFSFALKIAEVKKNKKWGLISDTGREIIPFEYDKLNIIDQDLVFAYRHSKVLLLDPHTGKAIFPNAYDAVNSSCYCDEDILSVTLNGKQGIVNTYKKTIVAEAIYERAAFIGSEEFDSKAVMKLKSKFGVIDIRSGRLLHKIVYDTIYTRYEDKQRLLVMDSTGTTIYFTRNGSRVKVVKAKTAEIIKPVVKEKKAVTSPADIVEVIETPKHIVADVYFYSLGNGRWKVTRETRSSAGTQVHESHEISGYTLLKKLETDYGAPLMMKAIENGLTGVIDATGMVLIPLQYDDIEYTWEFYRVWKNGRVGVIASDYKLLKNPVLKKISSPRNSLNAWLVEMPDGKSGFMDKRSGKIFIPGVLE